MGAGEAETFLQPRGDASRPLGRQILVELVGPSPWLVVVPHDDDLVLGSGMLLSLAADAGIEVHVAVCTDGRLGYADPADRASIGAVRRAELEAAMGVLGLDAGRAHYLGFADGSLAQQVGARPQPHPPGLGQALAALIRTIAPGVVFACHERDVHPDHRAVAVEAAIACFWASSDIWRDLGQPVALPEHWLYGVYVGFDGPPDLRLRASDAALDRKLEALAQFQSQTVIEAMVTKTRNDGPEEFFQRAPRPNHGPAAYARHFD